MAENIKIAHLQLFPLLSGVQQVSYQELTRLPGGRFQRELICKERGDLVEALSGEGVEFHPIGRLQRAVHPVKDFVALWDLLGLFRKRRYDIVHTHSSKTGFLGRLAARLAGVPCIVHTVHGFAFPAARGRVEMAIYWLMEWIAGRCCDAVVVLTESDRNICVKSLGLPASKVHLLPNGIDTQMYRPAIRHERDEVRSNLAVDDEKLILMVGRLSRQKAPECLVEAAIQLLRSQPHLMKFFLVGDGEMRGELERKIKEVGLEGQIHLLGWRTDVAELLKAADVFVLPSRWEGLPLALLEAMACGVPVVASDIPGNRAAVADGMCGRLFPVDDSQGLAEAISKLVRSPEVSNQLIQAGLKKIQQAHRLPDRIGKLVELYEEILGLKRR